MATQISYSATEKIILWAIAIFGVAAVNGAFFYGIIVQPDSLRAALANPIALAFMVEATLLLLLLAYLLKKWGVGRFGPVAFIVIALIGTMAFALPFSILTKKTSTDHQ